MAEPIDVPINKLLKRIREIDPELRKQIVRNIKDVGKPVETAIKQNLPAISPLKGANNKGRLGWNVDKPHDSTTLKFKATGSKTQAVTPLLSVRINSAAMSMMDIAGRKSKGTTRSGRAMIARLNRERRASRYVWPAGLEASPKVQDALQGIIGRVSNYFNRKPF